MTNHFSILTMVFSISDVVVVDVSRHWVELVDHTVVGKVGSVQLNEGNLILELDNVIVIDISGHRVKLVDLAIMRKIGSAKLNEIVVVDVSGDWVKLVDRTVVGEVSFSKVESSDGSNESEEFHY